MRRADTSTRPGRGGYDEGYAQCSQLWGLEPGSLVRRVFAGRPPPPKCEVLDVGCGDGKNALWLADRGAHVIAMDVSELAIARAGAHDTNRSVTWMLADAGALPFADTATFEVIVAYGLLHCLASEHVVKRVVAGLQTLTKPGGLHLTVAFNSRDQDLDRAHPGFRPTLLSHVAYLDMYTGWQVLEASDETLYEVHPHNGIAHHHSMSRIIARKPR